MQRKGTCEIGIGIGAGGVAGTYALQATQTVHTLSGAGLYENNVNRWTAQSFILAVDSTVEDISTWFAASASGITGNMLLEIQNDVASEPDGTNLGNGAYDMSLLPTSDPGAFQKRALDTPTGTLTAGTYWMVWKPSFTSSGSKVVNMYYNSVGTAYAGTFLASNDAGGTWTPSVIDLTFEVWGTA